MESSYFLLALVDIFLLLIFPSNTTCPYIERLMIISI